MLKVYHSCFAWNIQLKLNILKIINFFFYIGLQLWKTVYTHSRTLGKYHFTFLAYDMGAKYQSYCYVKQSYWKEKSNGVKLD